MYLIHLSVYVWSKWKTELKEKSHLAHFIGFKLSYCVWSCSKLGSMTPLKVNSTGAVCTLDLQSQLKCSRMHTRPFEFHPIDIVWRFAGHFINIKIFLRGNILEKWKTSRFVHMIFSIFQCNYFFFILFTLWNNLDISCNLEDLRTIEMTLKGNYLFNIQKMCVFLLFCIQFGG